MYVSVFFSHSYSPTNFNTQKIHPHTHTHTKSCLFTNCQESYVLCRDMGICKSRVKMIILNCFHLAMQNSIFYIFCWGKDQFIPQRPIHISLDVTTHCAYSFSSSCLEIATKRLGGNGLKVCTVHFNMKYSGQRQIHV